MDKLKKELTDYEAERLKKVEDYTEELRTEREEFESLWREGNVEFRRKHDSEVIKAFKDTEQRVLNCEKLPVKSKMQHPPAELVLHPGNFLPIELYNE